MFFFRIFWGLTLLILTCQAGHAATEITGTITAKRGDSVQVTFEPHDTAGPVEYSYNLRDVKIRSQGQIYWHPGAVLRFTFDKGLRLRDGPFFDILFPDGGHIAGDFMPPAGDVMETHREHRKQRFTKYYTDPDDPLDDEIRIVWKDRTIQGQSTVFITSQAVRTTRDRKTSSVVEKQQIFLVTCNTPASQSVPDSSNILKGYWEFEMTIDEALSHELDTMHWERVFLKIFQSASIEINDVAMPR
jgi:hypothetical protein